MGTKLLRLVSALFALAIIASACGSAATETAATDEETAAAELAVEENAAAEAAAEQEAAVEQEATVEQEAAVEQAPTEAPVEDTTAVVDEPPVEELAVEESPVEDPPVEEPVDAAEPEADLSVAAVFAAGNVELDADERIEASIGDVVTLTVDSDVVEEIHLHGYDIFLDVAPDEVTTLTFTADTPGRFEIEFESSGIFIAELVVS